MSIRNRRRIYNALIAIFTVGMWMAMVRYMKGGQGDEESLHHPVRMGHSFHNPPNPGVWDDIMQVTHPVQTRVDVKDPTLNAHTVEDAQTTSAGDTDYLLNFEPVFGGAPDFARPPKSNRVWPRTVHETEDRILAQMNLVPSGSYSAPTRLVHVQSISPPSPGDKVFIDDACPVYNCRVVDGPDAMDSAHAVVFQHPYRPKLQDERTQRHREQIWVLHSLESPFNSPLYENYSGVFNWTATYRTDSTLSTPYAKFVSYKDIEINPRLVKPTKNYAAGKTKRVAWFVSNCRAFNGRLEYARALQQHIDVDIYGACGDMSCPRGNDEECQTMLKRDYKFYLAFENSNCKDYITEKFFTYGLQNDVIPVAMGAPPGDYERLAPPHSFIHVDHFPDIEQLALYLHYLDSNDMAYNQYFAWKDRGQFIDTKFWCRMCAMLHDTVTSQSYEDLERWWRGQGMCVMPPSKTTVQLPWASWRDKNMSDVHPWDDNLVYIEDKYPRT